MAYVGIDCTESLDDFGGSYSVSYFHYGIEASVSHFHTRETCLHTACDTSSIGYRDVTEQQDSVLLRLWPFVPA